jgi:hypothetical protein
MRVSASLCLSVRPSVDVEHLCTNRKDFYKVWYLRVYWKSVEKIHISLRSERNVTELYMKADIHFWSYLTELFVEWEIRHTKICRENQNTHFVFINFFAEYRAVYEIMWKHIAQPAWTQMSIWRMRVACWITENKNVHSEYVIFDAFLLQEWLRKRPLMLPLYVYCLFSYMSEITRGI